MLVVGVTASANATTAPAPPTAQSAGIIPNPFATEWVASKRFCVGPRRTRQVIGALGKANAAAVIAAVGLAELPFPLARLATLDFTVTAGLWKKWKDQTVRAYLASNKRGARIRFGLKRFKYGPPPGTGFPNLFIGYEAKKRGRTC